MADSRRPGSRRRPHWGASRIADHGMPVKVRCRASPTLTDPQGVLTQFKDAHPPLAADPDSDGVRRCRTPVRMSARRSNRGAPSRRRNGRCRRTGVVCRRTLSGCREGQHPAAPAASGKGGVGNRRPDRRDARLANAGGNLARRDDMDLDGRRVVDAQDRVAVEVRPLNLAALPRDRAVQGPRRARSGSTYFDAFAPFFSRYLLLEFIAAFADCTLAISAAAER
jgi:hypothetical protein